MAAPVVLLLVKVSIVLVAALAAAWMARRTEARLRHRLWSSAFAAVLALPLLAGAMPALPVPVPFRMAAAGIAAEPLSTDIMRADREPRMAETIDAAAPADEIGPVSRALDALEARDARMTLPSLTTMLAALWVAGALAALVSLAIALWRVRRLSRTARAVDDPDWIGSAAALAARLGVGGRVRLLVSPRVSTPMAGGIFAPTIYLPAAAAQWSAEQRDVVLAHELSHLAGRDPLRQVLTRVALAAYWFHPLAWIAARQSVVAREQACDEAVLALGTRPSIYARVLLDFADAPRASMTGLAALPMVQRTHLEKRLMAILNENVRPSARRVALIPVALAAITLSVAAARPAEVEPLAAAVEQTASGSVVPGVAGGVPGGVAGGVPSGVSAGVPGGVAKGVPGGVAGGVTGGAAGGVATAATGRQAGSICYPDSLGSFSGSISMSDNDGSRTIHEAIGRRQADVVIVKSFGDLRVCALIKGLADDDRLRPSQWAAAGRPLVLETQQRGDIRRMEIDGARMTWSVNGQQRTPDAASKEWADRVSDLLEPVWELSRLRGEVSSLRGQISSIHGQRSSLQGQISSLRGRVSSMRGEISSWQGRESSMRGEISSIQGQLSSMQGRISSEQGQISSLESRRWNATDADRDAIAKRIDAHRARIRQIEAEIRNFDVEARVREVEQRLSKLRVDDEIEEVEKRLRAFDVEAQVREVEKRIVEVEVEKRVQEYEREISSLEVDRRSRDLETQIEAALKRLRSVL